MEKQTEQFNSKLVNQGGCLKITVPKIIVEILKLKPKDIVGINLSIDKDIQPITPKHPKTKFLCQTCFAQMKCLKPEYPHAKECKEYETDDSELEFPSAVEDLENQKIIIQKEQE